MPPWLEQGRTRSAAWDLRCARALHRGAARPRLHRLLKACSRLGEAPLWVGLTILLLLAGGVIGWRMGLAALAVGAVNLGLYYTLKLSTRRERPYRRFDDIRAFVRVPDPFSFPSGHTLHAVAFTVLLAAELPALAPLLGAFALLVALSRVVLGVHYPSDVLAGAAIGATTAGLAVALL